MTMLNPCTGSESSVIEAHRIFSLPRGTCRCSSLRYLGVALLGKGPPSLQDRVLRDCVLTAEAQRPALCLAHQGSRRLQKEGMQSWQGFP